MARALQALSAREFPGEVAAVAVMADPQSSCTTVLAFQIRREGFCDQRVRSWRSLCLEIPRRLGYLLVIRDWPKAPTALPSSLLRDIDVRWAHWRTHDCHFPARISR